MSEKISDNFTKFARASVSSNMSVYLDILCLGDLRWDEFFHICTVWRQVSPCSCTSCTGAGNLYVPAIPHQLCSSLPPPLTLQHIEFLDKSRRKSGRSDILPWLCWWCCLLLIWIGLLVYCTHSAERCQHMTSTSRESAGKPAFVTGESVNIDAGTNINKTNMEIKRERERECRVRHWLVGYLESPIWTTRL